MSELKVEEIKNHGDGEVRVRVTADFTIYKPATDIEMVKRHFEELMMKFAI